MLHKVTGGRWGVLFRRYLEVGAQSIVVTAVLFIPILFGLPRLYPWAQPDIVDADPLLQHQSGFLNPTFFVIRALVYFAVWIVLAWRMARPGSADRTTAIVGLILHFPLATLAAIDWFMSLEPHWYSTIYGVIFLASEALIAYAGALVLLILMPSPGLADDEDQTRQDLGNVLLTLLIAAIYFAFMQFLVMWAGDLPEEITWYLARTGGGWSWIALLLVLNCAVPFVLLLSRGIKHNLRSLALVALLIVVAQFIYLYWLIRPAFGITVGWPDLILPAGMAGIWLAAYSYRLGATNERSEANA